MLSTSERCVIDLCCTLLTAQRLSERKRHVGRARKERKSKDDDYLVLGTVFVINFLDPADRTRHLLLLSSYSPNRA